MYALVLTISLFILESLQLWDISIYIILQLKHISAKTMDLITTLVAIFVCIGLASKLISCWLLLAFSWIRYLQGYYGPDTTHQVGYDLAYEN